MIIGKSNALGMKNAPADFLKILVDAVNEGLSGSGVTISVDDVLRGDDPLSRLLIKVTRYYVRKGWGFSLSDWETEHFFPETAVEFFDDDVNVNVHFLNDYVIIQKYEYIIMENSDDVVPTVVVTPENFNKKLIGAYPFVVISVKGTGNNAEKIKEISSILENSGKIMGIFFHPGVDDAVYDIVDETNPEVVFVHASDYIENDWMFVNAIPYLMNGFDNTHSAARLVDDLYSDENFFVAVMWSGKKTIDVKRLAEMFPDVHFRVERSARKMYGWKNGGEVLFGIIGIDEMKRVV